MARMNAPAAVKQLLQSADIRINGSRPWDLQIHNQDIYPRLLDGGSLALGESYMDGWWDCEALDQFLIGYSPRTSMRK